MVKEGPSQYKIFFSSGACRDLKSKACKPHLSTILKAINKLKNNPFEGQELKGSLLKVRSLHFTLKGSGQWRIAYYVMIDEKTCLILVIGTRENFYKKAVKRYKSFNKSLTNKLDN